MPIVSSTIDPEALTLTIVAEYDANVEQVFAVWEDPRLLERWWGPPTWPATFTEHELVPGMRSTYHMTGPEGEIAGGWWNIIAVSPPTRLEFDDGFSAPEGQPLPTTDTNRGVVTFEAIDGRTRMTITSSFVSAEHLKLLSEMGMEEGMREAMGQIEGLL